MVQFFLHFILQRLEKHQSKTFPTLPRVLHRIVRKIRGLVTKGVIESWCCIFSFTYSPGKDAFTFALSTLNEERVRAYRVILDRNDGSYIVRFRLYETYKGLVMEVKHDGKHVANSPYKLKGEKLCEYVQLKNFFSGEYNQRGVDL